jgi:hypothetical protein
VSWLDAHLNEEVSSSPIRYTSEWFEKKKDSTRLNDLSFISSAWSRQVGMTPLATEASSAAKRLRLSTPDWTERRKRRGSSTTVVGEQI